MNYKELYTITEDLLSKSLTADEFIKHYNDLQQSNNIFADNEYKPLTYRIQCNDDNNDDIMSYNDIVSCNDKLYNMLMNNIINHDNIDRSYNRDNKLQNKSLHKIMTTLIQQNYKCEHVTTAWVKIYEIYERFNIFSYFNPNNLLKIFFICELPGAFIFATNHFIRTKTHLKYDWNAESLNPNIRGDGFKDMFGLVRRYKDNYDFGPLDGDITKEENIYYYSNKYKVDLILSDCGIDVSDKLYEQEKENLIIFKSKIKMALNMLNNGGIFIFKTHTLLMKSSIEHLYLLYKSFKDVYIVKPQSSKKYSNEIYIICINKEYGDYNIINISDIPIEILKCIYKANENMIYKHMYSNNINIIKGKYWDNLPEQIINIIQMEKIYVMENFIKSLNIVSINDNDRLIQY